MKISERIHIKGYRIGGNIAAVLRLSLPEADAENDSEARAAEEINSFYRTVGEGYGESLGKWLKELKNDTRIPLFRLEVSFEAREGMRKRRRILSVKRRAVLKKAGGEVREVEYLDLFDLESGVLIR